MFRFVKGSIVDDKSDDQGDALVPRCRAVRADAQRNTHALLDAALAVFATSGVDAPVREIAVKAGVGVGTLYRHFPQRADLVAAVFRHEVDACADAAPVLAAEHGPSEALALWMQRYADFIATKRGLASALHSGNPAFDSLPAYFQKRLVPALRTLLDAAAVAGEARADVDAYELLTAVANLCMQVDGGCPAPAHRMVALLVDGLRYGARASSDGSID
ncbi:MAG: transcriptional regulator, TetR family [Capsulimonas sp.]|jgi:AcrR family transcriptional regulator|nr:transcriptional regulator, TetR family [Capsulimonas sp.]